MLPPGPPFAFTVAPVDAPLLLINITTEPPAPPPPEASLSVLVLATAVPFALTVPLPDTLPARTNTMPPPADPLLDAPFPGVPVLLFVVPAPPPPPITMRDGAAGTVPPPSPPVGEPGGIPGVQPKPPKPPFE